MFICHEHESRGRGASCLDFDAFLLQAPIHPPTPLLLPFIKLCPTNFLLLVTALLRSALFPLPFVILVVSSLVPSVRSQTENPHMWGATILGELEAECVALMKRSLAPKAIFSLIHLFSYLPLSHGSDCGIAFEAITHEVHDSLRL